MNDNAVQYLAAIIVTSRSATVRELRDGLGVRFAVEHEKGTRDARGRTVSVTQCRYEVSCEDNSHLETQLQEVLRGWPADYAERLRSAGIDADIELDIAVLTPKYTHTTRISGSLIERVGRLRLRLGLAAL